jgi:hypothetical protein
MSYPDSQLVTFSSVYPSALVQKHLDHQRVSFLTVYPKAVVWKGCQTEKGIHPVRMTDRAKTTPRSRLSATSTNIYVLQIIPPNPMAPN